MGMMVVLCPGNSAESHSTQRIQPFALVPDQPDTSSILSSLRPRSNPSIQLAQEACTLINSW